MGELVTKTIKQQGRKSFVTIHGRNGLVSLLRVTGKKLMGRLGVGSGYRSKNPTGLKGKGKRT